LSKPRAPSSATLATLAPPQLPLKLAVAGSNGKEAALIFLIVVGLTSDTLPHMDVSAIHILSGLHSTSFSFSRREASSSTIIALIVSFSRI